MIKKFFSLLLTLCMVLAMMPVVTKPVTVQAASTSVQSVKIGTAELNSTNKYYHNGDNGAQGVANATEAGANAIFNPNTGTLTLNGLKINTRNVGIWWQYNRSGAHDLTIVLASGTTNTITNSNESGIVGASGWDNDGPSLTIEGSGTLEVTGETNGIWVWHDITIQETATVIATGQTKMGICNNDSGGTITIRDSAVVTATGNTSNSEAAYGIGFDNGKSNIPVIQGGTVTMTGGTAAVMVSPTLSGYTGGCKVTVGEAEEGSTEWDTTTSLQSYKYIHIKQGEHTNHCICGATHRNVGNHTVESIHNYTEWTSTDSLPTKAGYYYLKNDVTLADTWSPVEGETVLCLNGHTISGASGSYSETIEVKSGVHFTLTDCANSDTQGKIVPSGGCSAVFISNGGSFTMYGGNISGGTVDYEGMVYVSGSFTMNGGNISNNRSSTGNIGDKIFCGVHVWSDGTFTMNNGNISGNTFESKGAGVHNNGTFTMNGGNITQNVAQSNKGGGVYNTGTFTMNGGSITGNSASQGGGVYNDSQGTFKVSGTPIIKDNKQDETNNNNLYLCSGKTINIEGSLSAGTLIGVTVENSPTTQGTSVDITSTVSSDYSSFFKSDNTSYQIEFDSADSKLKMKVQPCSHTGVKVEEKAATCTEKGYKEYFQCSKCKGYFKEIACLTPISDISAWKTGDGEIPALRHDWRYSAAGATLTASCSRKSVCHVGDQTLTLTAATVSHTGNEYSGATLSDQTAWTSAGLTPLTIQYEGVDGTRYSSSSTAPSAAGRYKATITAGGATAIAPFAITGAEHTLKVESGANGTAGIQGQVVTSAAIGCYADVTLTATPNNGYRLKQWVVSGSSITITNNKFIMPDCDVTVTAEFEITSAGGGGSNPGGSTGGNTGDYYIPPTTTDNDSKTETTTLPDGTKVETSTTVDETTGATTVEEKKTALDGTVTEKKTTTQKDGSSQTTSMETRTDGSTTETNTTVDTEGTAKSVVLDKDFPTGDVLTIRKTEEPNGEVSYVLATLETEEATIVKAKVERAEALANMKNIPYRVKVLDENGKLDYKVRVNTGDVKANQTLYVYKYDSKTKSFGLVQADHQKVKADEKANISCDFENLISTQRYQLVTKSKAGLLDKKILATVKAKIGQKSLKVNQSTSFKLDEKLNLENVSTIKYSTSDKQVVKVSKAGKITGKNTGTADIKATITLINGKTKTVRMKIKVK